MLESLESPSATAKLHRKSQQTELESFGIKFPSCASIIKYHQVSNSKLRTRMLRKCARCFQAPSLAQGVVTLRTLPGRAAQTEEHKETISHKHSWTSHNCHNVLQHPKSIERNSTDTLKSAANSPAAHLDTPLRVSSPHPPQIAVHLPHLHRVRDHPDLHSAAPLRSPPMRCQEVRGSPTKSMSVRASNIGTAYQ